MSEEQMVAVTAHPEFLDAALDELKNLDRQFSFVQLLAPGIALCETPRTTTLARLAIEQRPIFARHLAPVQVIVPISNSEQDIGELAVAIAELPTFALLERGHYFAVQTRMVQSEEQAIQRAYSGGTLNRLVAEAIAGESGALENIKKPQIVVSLLCTASAAYAGISYVSENLSDWPGGARQFAQKPEQISRAEFKLLEALEVFGVELPANGRALDLGAAPGGWTRLLLAAKMRVVAVDPANLDPRLQRQARLEHYHGNAEDYLAKASHGQQRFDVIANDMRVDARDAARLLCEAANLLRSDGFVVSTLKLPHATATMQPVEIMRQALLTLRTRYAVVQARQLYHNRQEVTVIAAKPLARRK
ncbi:MAG TPA: SAM-dependent methyltransferase [Ktedonobacteraceae bacterium]|nr:SAM-dependent methyltransferase [Ktedonobacteraceae bacterium]